MSIRTLLNDNNLNLFCGNLHCDILDVANIDVYNLHTVNLECDSVINANIINAQNIFCSNIIQVNQNNINFYQQTPYNNSNITTYSKIGAIKMASNCLAMTAYTFNIYNSNIKANSMVLFWSSGENQTTNQINILTKIISVNDGYIYVDVANNDSGNTPAEPMLYYIIS